jgi:hypothetical protein
MEYIFVIVNYGGPDRLLRGIYGRDMENCVIPALCASLYRR